MSESVPERGKPSNAKMAGKVRVVKGDITKQDDVDAIISTIMVNMDVSGSLNKALTDAAGTAFDEFILENIYKPRPGDVYVVPGFKLPVEHVIFTVTPLLKDGFARDDVYLLRCYRMAMKMAESMRLKKIAFAALGTGQFGYPLERAARLAMRGISDRLTDNFEEVRIVCYTDKVYEAFADRLRKTSFSA